MDKLKFNNKSNSNFYPVLRERVDTYFSSNGISKHANWLMIFKTVFFLGGALSLYLLILFGGFSPIVMLILAMLSGMFAAFIGFNVCHDALHGSLSSNDFINNAIGSIFNLIGANTYNWRISHNIVHHTYTNIPDHDDDLVVAPGLIRVSPGEPVNFLHRYQHYYAFILYGFASLSWIFVKDYQKFFQDKIGSYSTTKHPRVELYKLFFFKAIYYCLVIVLPLMLLKITFVQFLIGFVCSQMAKGFVLGLVFQLAHIVEGLDFPEPENGSMEEAWVNYQMRTTANFGSRSFITSFLCGGLNMQIEHHLFPKICHTHYSAISKIVKQTAEEFGLPYHENKSFGTALISHHKMLKRLGKEALVASYA